MAESELAVMSARCLHRSIQDTLALIKEIIAWQASRSKNHAKADCSSPPPAHGSN